MLGAGSNCAKLEASNCVILHVNSYQIAVWQSVASSAGEMSVVVVRLRPISRQRVTQDRLVEAEKFKFSVVGSFAQYGYCLYLTDAQQNAAGQATRTSAQLSFCGIYRLKRWPLTIFR
jgi:hypothetical protein